MLVRITKNENGEDVVPMPDDIMKELGWNEFTILSASVIEGTISIRAKTDWTVDQLQDGNNLENILDDVEHNNTIHHILDNGKMFVMAPYSRELQDLLEKIPK